MVWPICIPSGSVNDTPLNTNPFTTRCMKYLVTIVLLATGLRLGLSGFPLFKDELATTSLFAQMPFWQIFINYQFPNNHILHSVLVHLLLEGFGLQEPILRLPVLLGSVISLIYAYRTTRLLTGSDWGGILAVLFLTFNYEHLYHSTNARGYLIIMVITQVIAHRLIQQYRSAQPTPLPWFVWAGMMVLLVAGTWTIPTFALFEASLILWGGIMIFFRNRKGSAPPTTERIPILLELQLIAAGLIGFGMLYVQYGIIIPRHIFLKAVGDPSDNFQLGGYLLDKMQLLGNHLIVQGVVVVLILIGFRALFRKNFEAFVIVGSIALGLVFPVVAIQLGLLKGSPPGRVFLYLQPIMICVAVVGLQEVVRHPVWLQRSVIGLMTILFVEGGWTYHTQLLTPYRQRPPYQEVRQFIKEMGPYDLFISSEKTHVWMYLYGNPGLRNRVLNILNTGKLDNIYFLESRESGTSDLTEVTDAGTDFVMLQRQYRANYVASTQIPIPKHFTEMVHDWDTLRIFRIRPHLIHPKFSVARDKLDAHFVSLHELKEMQLSSEHEALESAKELRSALFTAGPQDMVLLLLNRNEAENTIGRYRLSLNMLYASVGIRNTHVYTTGKFFMGEELEFAPVWALNRWTAEHPYSDHLYGRAWFPRIYLTNSTGEDEILMIENIPEGHHGIANMHSFWIGEL